MPASKIKVMTIVGTRPEIIKLSRIMAELDIHTQHTLVHTGQNYDYELNQVFFDEMKIRKPDHFLNAVGKTVAETIGLIISKADVVMEAVQPDAVLLYGDTNSCLSVMAAKRRKIPIFHMEAGNRCFDQRVPEELNRKVLDHLSDINLPLTEHARRYLLDEGIRPETIIKSGSTMPEVLAHYRSEILASKVLERLKLEPQKYFLISAHREENVDSQKNLTELLKTLNALAKTYQQRVIVSTHPRTQNRLSALKDSLGELDSRIEFLKPFGFFDYNQLQINAACVLSDSGTITEETSILGLTSVMIRQAHERPEGMDEGTVIMCGLNESRVLEAVALAIKHRGTAEFRRIPDYEPENVSRKMVRIILSYTDYINRTVWKKDVQ